MAFRAPLLGYNTNVRHKGRLYHIQTEDSGVGHPHIITHLFADGGRIVGSKKTSYAEHLAAQGLQDTVKKLMQGQHKAMFIALRDGFYDEIVPLEIPGESTGTVPSAVARGAARFELGDVPGAGHEAAPVLAVAAVETAKKPLYQGTLPAGGGHAIATPVPVTTPVATPISARQSIFGSDLTSEKSLDEVILSYLATDDEA